MPSNGHPFLPPGDPLVRAMLLDQTQELRRQSRDLGEIKAQLRHGAMIHDEFRSRQAQTEARLTILESKSSHPLSQMSDFNRSLAELLKAGKPVLLLLAVAVTKRLGIGVSVWGPWAEQLLTAFAKSLLN